MWSVPLGTEMCNTPCADGSCSMAGRVALEEKALLLHDGVEFFSQQLFKMEELAAISTPV